MRNLIVEFGRLCTVKLGRSSVLFFRIGLCKSGRHDIRVLEIRV
jgi:hypothetical protein